MKVPPGPDEYVFCHRNSASAVSFKKSFAALMKSANVETGRSEADDLFPSPRLSDLSLKKDIRQFILAKNMGTSKAMLEKRHGRKSNVAAAELTKGGQFKSWKKARAVDWLRK